MKMVKRAFNSVSLRDFLFGVGIENSPDEVRIISEVRPVLKSMRAAASSLFPGSSVLLGGSLAKGTILKGDFDIDIFVLFPFRHKNDNLSDLLASVLDYADEHSTAYPFSSFTRVHGSRDYFRSRLSGFTLEVVPVLRVSSSERAVNVTDMSPLHVRWFSSRLKEFDKQPPARVKFFDDSLREKVSLCRYASKSENSALIPRSCLLRNHIRAAKLFCKSRRIYGAESYIRGFSGHVLDILVLHFGGFDKLLKAASAWNVSSGPVIIDSENHYKNPRQALFFLNKSKISPLIVVDPVDKTRNAAAALSQESLEKFIYSAKRFLKSPSHSFFEPFVLSLKSLIPRSSSRKLLLVLPKVPPGKDDVVGAKLLKKYEHLKSSLVSAGFRLFSSDWFWDRSDVCAFWFVVGSSPLPEYLLHIGPPASDLQNAARFRKKHSSVFMKNGRLAARVPVKFRIPEELVKSLLDRGDELLVR